MRLRLTVAGAPGGDQDVQVTADVTATVGQIALALVRGARGSGSRWRPEVHDAGVPLTLRVRRVDQAQAWVLDPSSPLASGGLCSGCWVEPLPVGRHALEDRLLDPPAAWLECLDGPVTGARFPLLAGANLVGRAAHCRVVLPDDRVSRTHARIDVAGATVRVTDLGSSNGTIVQGVLVSEQVVGPRDVVVLGGTRCVVTVAPASGADGEGRAGAACPGAQAVEGSASASVARCVVVDHVRPPRVEPRWTPPVVVLPTPPVPEPPRRPSVAALVAPLLMGAGLWVVTRSLTSLVLVGLSPVVLVASHLEGLLFGRRRRAAASRTFRGELASAVAGLERAHVDEERARERESPGTREVVDAVRARSSLLWSRDADHAGFGELRLGRGTVPSRTRLEVSQPAGTARGDQAVLEEVCARSGALAAAPVVERLADAGSVGVVGEEGVADEVAAALVLRLVGLHAPDDLVLTCVAGAASRAAWSWLVWLPHVTSTTSPVEVEHLAEGEEAVARLVSSVESLVADRRRDGSAVPLVVVLVLETTPASRARLVRVAREGPAVGVHVLWVAPRLAALPAPCRTYVVTAGSQGLDTDQPGSEAGRGAAGHVGSVREGTLVRLVEVERVSPEEAASVARSLAPVVDAGARSVDESDLPSSLAFGDLHPPDADPVGSVAAVRAAWREAGRDLAALVGRTADGVMRLSLREHGPHALVAGTTGAGKSELLQTWIMALAAAHSPRRVTFLLVDYKGGAAFAECTRLPHTVGLVTDLTAHLARRALASLRAELRYREEMLARLGAKDLLTLEERGDARCPPALVIVVDEFATLVAEVPEFVDGMVDVAQRGRSLGLHLVLATQRPAGVVTDNLRANANLRVVLRTADLGDSRDVLGTDDAAAFDASAPGRAAARLGPGDVQHFQTAYLGGQQHDADPVPDIVVQSLPFGVGERWSTGGVPAVGPASAASPSAPVLRDIERILRTIQEAALLEAVPAPRRPWLDAVEPVVDLEQLVRADGELGPPHQAPALAVDERDGIPLGVVDEPERQRRSALVLRPETDGNLAVAGTSGSGKSGVLRAVALAASARAERSPVEIYALDLSGGGLGFLEVLPTVGAVVRGDDTERVERLVRDLGERVTERHARFAAVRASGLTEYRRLVGDPAAPRVYLLVDGIEALRDLYEARAGSTVLPTLARVAATGRQVGVHLVLAADRPGAVPTTFAANVGRTVVLRLAADQDYSAADVPADILGEAPPGRGVVEGHEVQVGAWGGATDLEGQAQAAARLARRLRDAGVTEAPAVERLAERVGLDDLPVLADRRPVLGLRDVDLQPVGFPTGELVVVTGPFGSGRTTAVRTLVASLLRAGLAQRGVLLRSGGDAPDGSAGLGSWAWASTAVGAEGVERCAVAMVTSTGALAPLEASDGSGEALPDLIVVEGAADLEGTSAEASVAALIRAGRRAGATVLVETETVTGPAAWRIHAELRSARAGLVLQPDEGDGLALFRVAFPRASRADFPVGRGYLVERGTVTKVQTAMVDEHGLCDEQGLRQGPGARGGTSALAPEGSPGAAQHEGVRGDRRRVHRPVRGHHLA